MSKNVEEKYEDELQHQSDLESEPEEFLPATEAKAEQILCSKLTFDTTDMGALPGMDFDAWTHSGLVRPSLDKFVIEEERHLNLIKSRGRSSEGQVSPLLSPGDAERKRRTSNLSTSRPLRASVSYDRLDEAVHSPKDNVRRSSNLSQNVLRRVFSTEQLHRESPRDENQQGTPPPPSTDFSPLGAKRHSNLAVMRLIAETI